MPFLELVRVTKMLQSKFHFNKPMSSLILTNQSHFYAKFINVDINKSIKQSFHRRTSI